MTETRGLYKLKTEVKTWDEENRFTIVQFYLSIILKKNFKFTHKQQQQYYEPKHKKLKEILENQSTAETQTWSISDQVHAVLFCVINGSAYDVIY